MRADKKRFILFKEDTVPELPPELHVERAAAFWRLTLQRPEKRNALTRTLLTALLDAFSEARAAACPALLIGGAGRAFCAGMDVTELQDLAAAGPVAHLADSQLLGRLFQELQDFPAPTIAAVNGHAVAGGCGLATLCDFTLSVPEARFGYPEVKIGFIPALVAVTLSRQVGEKRCRDLLLSGRLITAEQALQWGMVSELVDPERLQARAMELAVALGENSLESLRRTKHLLQQLQGLVPAAAWSLAATANAEQRTTPDFQEGVAAYLEKRRPRWPSRLP